MPTTPALRAWVYGALAPRLGRGEMRLLQSEDVLVTVPVRSVEVSDQRLRLQFDEARAQLGGRPTHYELRDEQGTVVATGEVGKELTLSRGDFPARSVVELDAFTLELLA